MEHFFVLCRSESDEDDETTKCFKVLNTREERMAFMKIVSLENEKQGLPFWLIRGSSILQDLRHQNVAQLLSVAIVGKKAFLEYEYAPLNLESYLTCCRGPGVGDPGLIQSFMYQLLNGLAYCHKHRVLHRYLQPCKLLIEYDGTLKISDFDLARVFTVPLRPYSPGIVCLWYRPPEMLLGDSRYSTPIDIWSAGVIFAYMITGRPLFIGSSELEQLHATFRIMGTPNERVWPELSRLPCWRSASFPNWPKQDWSAILPTVHDPNVLDLLDVCSMHFLFFSSAGCFHLLYVFPEDADL